MRSYLNNKTITVIFGKVLAVLHYFFTSKEFKKKPKNQKTEKPKNQKNQTTKKRETKYYTDDYSLTGSLNTRHEKMIDLPVAEFTLVLCLFYFYFL